MILEQCAPLSGDDHPHHFPSQSSQAAPTSWSFFLKSAFSRPSGSVFFYSKKAVIVFSQIVYTSFILSLHIGKSTWVFMLILMCCENRCLFGHRLFLRGLTYSKVFQIKICSTNCSTNLKYLWPVKRMF